MKVMEKEEVDLKSYIRDVPDFPKKGIMFRDITPLLDNAKAFNEAVRMVAAPFKNKGITKIIAVESRGFIFGGPVALELGAGFVPVRKKGKLPCRTVGVTYDLEYGQDTLEIHADAIADGEKVLIVDDVLATGGTAKAVCELVRKSGGKVEGLSFLIELTYLNGSKKLSGENFSSIVKF